VSFNHYKKKITKCVEKNSVLKKVCFEDLASTPSNAQSDTLPAWPAMKSAGEIEAGGDLSRKKA
jgi:hypothetical protein